MRTSLAVLVAAAAAVPGSASEAASSCGSSLPVAPAGLPAPVVFRTTCGSFRAGPDGRVAPTRAVRSPLWSPSRFQIDVRNDHVVLIEHGRVRWRSQRAFASESNSEFDSAAFSGRRLAFSFVHGRLWVSRLSGHEHAVGGSEGALTWTKRGDLMTSQRRHGKWRLAVRDRNGLHPRVVARRPVNAFVDDATQTVLYVTASGSLVRTDGRSKHYLADLRSLGFGPRATLQVLSRSMIGVSSPTRLAVLRGDGSLFAAMEYPADSAGLSHGWPTFALADDRVAAAVELERPNGGTAGEDVYVLSPGGAQGTRLVRLQDEWVGCGWLVTMVWHGDWLLYSDSVVNVLAIDTSGGGRVELSKTARQLPGVQVDENSGEYVGLDFAAWG
jgi:hypothetical protein